MGRRRIDRPAGYWSAKQYRQFLHGAQMRMLENLFARRRLLHGIPSLSVTDRATVGNAVRGLTNHDYIAECRAVPGGWVLTTIGVAALFRARRELAKEACRA